MFKDFHDKYKCIFIHVPKVAGSSIERVIYQTDGWLVGHVKASDYVKFDKNKFESYFSFGFVRNPYDRIVSAYHYLKNDSPAPLDIEWGRLHINNLTFEEFILRLQDEYFRKKILLKNHFSFQYKYLCDKNMNILVNFVGKFEQLDNDFKKILNILHRKDNLVHVNKSKHLNYRDYYNSQTYKIIREIYKNDFEIFDYDLEDKKYFNISQHNYLKNLENKITIKNTNLEFLRLDKLSKIQNLNQTIQNDLTQIQNLNQNIKFKEQVIQNKDKVIVNQTNRINSLQAALKDNEIELIQMQSSNNALSNTIKEKNNIINSNINHINQLQNNIQENSVQLNQLQSKLSFQTQYGTAKSRIQNQLSYKLGQAMIINSKNIFGILFMPVYIISTLLSHRQEKTIYQLKIKKNPNLKLPTLESYPDYQESLKEKECLTYKLGEAFIKANKTWYKGGYVKLWFEVRKLKKEFEK